MSTYILMKILESSPSRYDKGIRILTLGRLDRTYDHLTSYIKQGQKVLDLGCGTGALTLKAAARGAKATGIDINPQMLEIARTKAARAGLAQNVEFREMGAVELKAEKSESYDAVMSGLCFSELTNDELVFTLKEARRILKPGGLLAVADEARPKNFLKAVFVRLLRLPLIMITYIITQTTTREADKLPEKIERAGFLVEFTQQNWLEDFIELVARKPARGSK